MSGRYSLDGLPNDLLDSEKIGDRNIKVSDSATLLALQNLDKKYDIAFTYNVDNTIETIVKTAKDNSEVITLSFTYSNGVLTNIDTTVS